MKDDLIDGPWDNKGKVLTCTEMFLAQELFKFYYAVQFQTYSPEDRNGAMEERFEDFKPSLCLFSVTGEVSILNCLGEYCLADQRKRTFFDYSFLLPFS